MLLEQADPPGSILWMGPPLASAAVPPIARLVRALFSCLPRGIFFFPPPARSARRFSARRAARQAARRPALPVVRPVAHDVSLPVARPEACGGFVACRGATGARAQPSPPVARRGALGGRASPPSRRASWRPRGTASPPSRCPSWRPREPARTPPSCRPSWRPQGPRVPLLPSPDLAPSGARAAPTPVARQGAIGGPVSPPPAAREPALQPTCRPCSLRAVCAASCPRTTEGWQVTGGGCVSRPLLLLLLSPTTAAAAEGGGCAGAEGVMLGGCRRSEVRSATGGVNGIFGTVKGRLGGGSRRVASSASSPEATISGSPATLLR
ncbi:unnamed protein product [Closterium sp. NIES-54]